MAENQLHKIKVEKERQVIQFGTEYNDGLNQTGSSRNGEKWKDSRYTF